MTRNNITVNSDWVKITDYIDINPELSYSFQNRSTVLVYLTEATSKPTNFDNIGVQLGYNDSCIYKKGTGDLYISASTGTCVVAVNDNE